MNTTDYVLHEYFIEISTIRFVGYALYRMTFSAFFWYTTHTTSHKCDSILFHKIADIQQKIITHYIPCGYHGYNIQVNILIKSVTIIIESILEKQLVLGKVPKRVNEDNTKIGESLKERYRYYEIQLHMYHYDYNRNKDFQNTHKGLYVRSSLLLYIFQLLIVTLSN